jgi:alkylresorcinol/alkylpyrone synthase
VDVVGAALFGDGAAAALVTGDEAGTAGPRFLASHTVLFPESRDLMGWDFTSDGLRLVLSPQVAELVRTRLRPAVDEFLASAALNVRGISHWVLHPGGRKILEAYGEAFGASERTLSWTTRCLAENGNLSSASVLFILADVLESGKAKTGEKALVVALGPGFAAEMAVLVW